MRCVRRLRFERPRYDLLDPVVADLARSTTPRLVVEPFQTMLCKPLAPRPRGLPGDTDSIGNLAVVEAIGRP
jgi:hypothetical protein